MIELILTPQFPDPVTITSPKLKCRFFVYASHSFCINFPAFSIIALARPPLLFKSLLEGLTYASAGILTKFPSHNSISVVFKRSEVYFLIKFC